MTLAACLAFVFYYYFPFFNVLQMSECWLVFYSAYKQPTKQMELGYVFPSLCEFICFKYKLTYTFVLSVGCWLLKSDVVSFMPDDENGNFRYSL